MVSGVRLVDQDEQVVLVKVRQDGGAPRALRPRQRACVQIQAPVPLRVTQILPDDPSHWRFHDLRVGNASQLRPPLWVRSADGISGEVVAFGSASGSLPIDTLQAAMCLEIDVEYRGPRRAGQAFGALIRCATADRPGDVRPPGAPSPPPPTPAPSPFQVPPRVFPGDPMPYWRRHEPADAPYWRDYQPTIGAMRDPFFGVDLGMGGGSGGTSGGTSGGMSSARRPGGGFSWPTGPALLSHLMGRDR